MKRTSESREIDDMSALKKMTPFNTIDDENQKSYKKVVCIYNAIQGMKDNDIENFVKIEGDINYRIPEGSYKVPSLLHAVLDRDRVGPTRPPDVPKILLNYGADFTFKDSEGKTVVHAIIREQATNWHRLQSQRTFHNDYIDAILEAHVKFDKPANPCDENGISHFHAACMTNNAVAVEFFLKNGVDVGLAVNSDSPFFPAYTPIQLAVKYTCPDVIEILLKYGANMYAKNTDGLTPLHTIVQRTVSYCDITESPQFVRTLDILVKFVIDNGMDKIKATDDLGFSKLHVACLLEDQSLIESILNQVTYVDEAVNSDSPICAGYTALHFAAFSNVHVFKLLLDKGANIEAKNVKELTPFDLCLQNYTVKDIHSILSSIQEWRDIVLSDNKTKLLDVVSAMESGDEFISFLDSTASGSTLFIPSDSPLWPGYTILHLAVVFTKKISYSSSKNYDYFYKKEDTKIIDECLKRDADVTKADAKGSTALHLAFYMKKRCVIQLMLDHYDTIINPVDEGHLSHFHIACATRHLKGVEHFLSSKVDLNSRVSAKFYWSTRLKHINLKTGSRHFTICPGSTPLHITVACGDDIATKALLNEGADVHAKDSNGFTPIHRLFACGDYRASAYVQKTLFSVGNLRDSTIDCGLSHLHVACFYNQCEAVEKLLQEGADVETRVSCSFDAKRKDYDEFFCEEYKRYHEHLYFLSQFDGYTPLDFLWHKRQRQYQFDSKSFWKISFMLIDRFTGVFEKTDEGLSRLQILLQYINCYDHDCLYEMLYESIFIQTHLEEEFGVTKLHLACRLGDIKAVKNAIMHGANVNAKVYSKSPLWQGYTPLHFVVNRTFENNFKQKILPGMLNIIGLLMKHGSDPLLLDDNNETPFHIIKKLWYGNRPEPRQLEPVIVYVSTLFNFTRKFDVNPSDNQGLSVFHIACATHNEDAVKQFLKHGVDVNQATSDFSKFSRGSTPLRLLMEYHDVFYKSSSTWEFCGKKFERIADMLIANGADVNETDFFGKTLLFTAAELMKSRRVIIGKLISNGTDIYATHTCKNITAFELLLRQKTATYKEIELFLKAGYQLNGYNPKTQEGYMAQIFRYQYKDPLSIEKTMKIEVFEKILTHPKINEIDKEGRNAIHNIVSIDKVVTFDDFRRGAFVAQEDIEIGRIGTARRSHANPYAFDENFYTEVFNKLTNQGCDIAHENNEGKTALHLAVAFKNNRMVVPLLKMGADLNVTDRSGKTAFAYCTVATAPTRRLFDPWQVGFNNHYKYQYNDSNYANKIFAVHVYKLEFCREHVNDQNKQLRRESLEILGPIAEKALESFHKEMEQTKSLNFGNTSLTLYDFLTKPDAYVVYINMTTEGRQEMDKFFENISQHKFDEIDGLLRLKCRQIVERIKLLEPAISSLSTLIKFELPDLCCRYILKFLKNQDLRRLIASVE